MKKEYTVLIGVIALVLIIYFCVYKKDAPLHRKRSPSQSSSSSTSIEGFTALAAGANDNIGSLLDDAYQLSPGADNDVPSIHYADLVDQGTLPEIMQPKDEEEILKPMERLQRLQGSGLLPRVSSSVTPYAVDIADPAISKYMVNAPRAQSALKSKYMDYSLASFIRGDIPITYQPNVPLVSRTLQTVDDQRLDGLFTPQFNALYNRFTGKEYKSLPVNIAGAGTAAGYGGASSGVIMDGF